MRYLLDSNVVSQARKQHGSPAVLTWLGSVGAEEVALSVVTLMELEVWVLRRERREATEGRSWRAWLEKEVAVGLASQIIPVDSRVARGAATLHVPDPAPDRDALIAATALVHDLTVVTRNTRDFERTGVRLLNPWAA
ncbi:type II toxin-antitoxin system VapC family toxin [Nocardioides sp.]|uniref:type II toxin-antitoxin system VapC family toxin n=1 Tax=Nocardioides sp. TaxID=35761 RepID=UPI0039E596CF